MGMDGHCVDVRVEGLGGDAVVPYLRFNVNVGVNDWGR